MEPRFAPSHSSAGSSSRRALPWRLIQSTGFTIRHRSTSHRGRCPARRHFSAAVMLILRMSVCFSPRPPQHAKQRNRLTLMFGRWPAKNGEFPPDRPPPKILQR